MNNLHISDLIITIRNSSAIELTFYSENFSNSVPYELFLSHNLVMRNTVHQYLSRELHENGCKIIERIWSMFGVLSCNLLCRNTPRFYTMIIKIESLIASVIVTAKRIKRLFQFNDVIHLPRYNRANKSKCFYHFDTSDDEPRLTFWFNTILTRNKNKHFLRLYPHPHAIRLPSAFKFTRIGFKIVTKFFAVIDLFSRTHPEFIDKIIFDCYSIEFIIDYNHTEATYQFVELLKEHLRASSNIHFEKVTDTLIETIRRRTYNHVDI